MKITNRAPAVYAGSLRWYWLALMVISMAIDATVIVHAYRLISL
jgi:hypothetical protein